MSILDKIECSGVVCFDTCEGASYVTIEECCDNYYDITINKKEFGQIIEELKELHSKMVD